MPTFTDGGPRQLSDQNPNGTVLGASPSDLIGFYGTSQGIAQPSGNQQAAFPSSGASSVTAIGAGMLSVFASSQSPSAVTNNTAAEQSITVSGVQASDLVFVNKPTSQAGLVVASGRVSAANTVKLVFGNPTTSSITPTTSETYIVGTIGTNIQLTATLSPASVAANTISEQSFTVTGAQPGMVVVANKPTTNAGLAVLSSRVTASNTVAITFANCSTASITPTASEAYTFAAFNSLTPVQSTLIYGVFNGTTFTSVTLFSGGEQSITVAGLLADDIISGVSKPTYQNGLVIGNARVSASSTLAIGFANATSANITPTTSETYLVTVQRETMAGVMEVITTPTITPTAVNANTSGEQTFTVNGIVSGQPLLISPNFALGASNIGIAGVRASATNQIAINFVNLSSVQVTPAAGTYQVGQILAATPSSGSYVRQMVTPTNSVGMNLLNGLRSALTSLGLIAGK